MNTQEDQINRALKKLDGTGSAAEWEAVKVLREVAGQRLPGLLLQKYRLAKKAGERAACVYQAIRYAKDNSDAVQLGREALSDRAQAVRYRASMLLAYSQARGVLEDLRRELAKAPINSKEDFAAAIDAIENGNHHYFVDRDHSGNMTLTVN